MLRKKTEEKGPGKLSFYQKYEDIIKKGQFRSSELPPMPDERPSLYELAEDIIKKDRYSSSKLSKLPHEKGMEGFGLD